jgi:hypothetical protein
VPQSEQRFVQLGAQTMTQSHTYKDGDLVQINLGAVDLSDPVPIMRARWHSDWGCWVTQGPWTPVPGNRVFTLTINEESPCPALSETGG